MVKRIVSMASLALLILLLAATAGDYGLFVYRQRHGNSLGFVTVRQFLATPLKNGRDELDFLGEADQPCVRAALPHQRMDPCWWVRAHKDHWK
jgi:hypothetical protein